MRQIQYSKDLIPTRQFCLYRHHIDEYGNYKGKYNYGKHIYRMLKSYCEESDVDFIISTTNNRNMMYSMNNNTYNYSQFQQIYHLLCKYKRVYISSGHAIFKKNFPLYLNLVQCLNDNQCGIMSHDVMLFDKENQSMKIHTSNEIYQYHNVLECQGNKDIYIQFIRERQIYHDVFLKNNRESSVSLPSMRTVLMDTFCQQALNQIRVNGGTCNDFYRISLNLMRGIDFNMVDNSIFYFDGCGVGSNLWKIRPLLIEETIKRYHNIIY